MNYDTPKNITFSEEDQRDVLPQLRRAFALELLRQRHASPMPTDDPLARAVKSVTASVQANTVFKGVPISDEYAAALLVQHVSNTYANELSELCGQRDKVLSDAARPLI